MSRPTMSPPRAANFTAISCSVIGSRGSPLGTSTRCWNSWPLLRTIVTRLGWNSGKSFSNSWLATTLILSMIAGSAGSSIRSCVNCNGVTMPSASPTASEYGRLWSAVSLLVGRYLAGSPRMSAARAMTSTRISATSAGLILCSRTIFIIAVSGACESASIGKLFMLQSRMR